MGTDKVYYQHIDGLRAIAVITVILFHINESLLPGGFIGVDIFFVISGFLISNQIYKGLDNQNFSIAEFYRRRIKRIMPAMFVVVAATLLVGQILYLPDDVLTLNESATWAIFSLANLYFWRFNDTDYFAESSLETPLLHLWSLGVEEQFYLLWPIFLLVFYHRFSRKWLLTLIALAIVCSTVIAEILYTRSPSFVYYMLPTRMGELLIGALLAFVTTKYPNSIRYIKINLASNLIGLVGLTLIIYSLVAIDHRDVFPGINALIPTVGTALIILEGLCFRSQIVTILSAPISRFFGAISYSAYLWHWPILAFYRYGYGQIDIVSGSILFVIIITLSYLTYVWVEQKARFDKGSLVKLTMRYFAAPSVVCITIIFMVHNTDGLGVRYFSNSYQSTLAKLENKAIAPNKYQYICQRWQLTEKELTNSDCIIGAVDTAPSVLLWGDSNATHYAGIIGTVARSQGWSFRNAQHASCPPLFSDVSAYVNPERLVACQNSINTVKQYLTRYSTLIISASWPSYANKSPEFFHQLEQTLQQLSKLGKNIILIGKAPVFENFHRHCQARTISYPLSDCYDSIQTQNKQVVTEANNKLAAMAKLNGNVNYMDFNQLLCPNKQCTPYFSDLTPKYFDTSHIEIEASWRLGQELLTKYPNHPILQLSLSI